MGCHPWGYYREGVLGPALSFHPLAVEQLVPSLIGFYIGQRAFFPLPLRSPGTNDRDFSL
jgi:hypothetical protein